MENRGGARPGSGRKSARQEDKRVQVSISVSPETRDIIYTLRKRKVKVGQLVDELIQQYYEEREG